MWPLECKISEGEEFTKCGLCYSLPSRALLLDCHHSYCLDCLRTYNLLRSLGKEIPCPLCGKNSQPMEPDLRQCETAQLPEMTCDLCTDARPAQGTCLECSEKLCQFCLESHQNSKASKHHRIKVFGDRDCVEQTRDPQPNAEHINGNTPYTECCATHDQEQLTHFCRMCVNPVCKQCRKSPVHKGHRMRPLAAAMSDKRKTLSQRARNVESGYLDVLGKKLLKAKSRQDQIRENSKGIIQTVLKRVDLLKNELDMVCATVIEEIEGKERIYVEGNLQYQNDIVKEIADVNKFLDSLKNIIKVSEDLEMAKSLKTMLPVLDDYESACFPDRLDQTSMEFESGDLTVDGIRQGFGIITVKSSGRRWSRSVSIGRSRDVNIKVQSMFEFPVKTIYEDEEENDPVHALATISENEAWATSGWESTALMRVGKEGECKFSISLDHRVDDVTNTFGNGIIVTSFKAKFIKRLSPDGEMVDSIQTPLYARGICSTEDGGFLVCMTDDYSTSLSSESKRLVVKYSKSAEVEHTYEFSDDIRLFRRPYRVAQNVNSDICVSDRTAMGSGRVVIVDKNGNLKSVYEGPNNNQCERKFAPAGIVCDSLGQILVADTNNHCVHILDQNGQFAGFLLKQEDGLTSPHSLTFDNKGFLWIGDELGNIRVFDYML